MTEEYSLFKTPCLQQLEWRINNFFELPLSNNYNIDSPLFSVSGANWFLRIYTNGRAVENSVGWISLYLNKKESELEYQIDFRIGIKGSDGLEFAVIDDKNILFKKSEDGNGRRKLIKRSHLQMLKDTLVPNGTLTIFCTVRIEDRRLIPSKVETACQTSVTSTVKDEFEASSSDGVSTLVANFKELYLSKHCTDIRIIVKDREFLGHRNILTARSTVFSAMLNSEMMEKNSGVIKITDCDPHSFEEFLVFLYTGDVNVVSTSNATSLYETSEKYDLKDLKKECIRFMMNNLTVDSFCDVFHLASMYNETNVITAAKDFFLENARDILVTLKWQNFSAENPSLRNELFLQYVSKK